MTYRIWTYMRIQPRAQEARQGFTQRHRRAIAKSWDSYFGQWRQRQSKVEQRAIRSPGKRHRNRPELAETTTVEQPPHPSTSAEEGQYDDTKPADSRSTSTSTNCPISTITAANTASSTTSESEQGCRTRSSQRSLLEHACLGRRSESIQCLACTSSKSLSNA